VGKGSYWYSWATQPSAPVAVLLRGLPLSRGGTGVPDRELSRYNMRKASANVYT